MHAVTGSIRRYLGVVVVATVTAMVAAGGFALGHDADGGGHDSFAHRAGKASRLEKVVIRRSAATEVNVGAFVSAIVACPSGFRPVGGGLAGSVNGVHLVQSYPSDGTVTNAGHSNWFVLATNTSSTTRTFRAYAACVRAAEVGSNFTAGADKV